MRIYVLLVFLAFLVLSRAYAQNDSDNPKKARLWSEEKCLAAGGRWALLDPHGGGCRLEYTDGGKECTSSDQCQGFCMTNVKSNLGKRGFCQKESNDRGGPCHTVVEASTLFCTYQGDILVDCNNPEVDFETYICENYRASGIFKE